MHRSLTTSLFQQQRDDGLIADGPWAGVAVAL